MGNYITMWLLMDGILRGGQVTDWSMLGSRITPAGRKRHHKIMTGQ